MKPSKEHFIFLTGSTGLVGGHLLLHLFKAGKKIRCLIRKTSSFSQLEKICAFYDVEFLELRDKVEWVFGDLLDFSALCTYLEDITEIYHCAAVVSFNPKDKIQMMKTNINGTSNLIDAALISNVREFCFISSIASLGKAGNNQPILETTPRKNDEKTSAYSESKFRSELEVWRGIAEGLNVVIVNPGVILGLGELDKGSMLLVKAGMKGMPFFTKATTGYVDVRDVCRASMMLMEKKEFGERFILVSENLHNGKVFGMIAKEFGKQPPKYEVGVFILYLGAFFMRIFSFVVGKKSQLTMDTVQSARKQEQYSNEKLIRVLNYTFIPIAQSIHDLCAFIQKETKKPPRRKTS